MTKTLNIRFSKLDAEKEHAFLLFAGDKFALGPIARKIDAGTDKSLTRAAKTSGFTGKRRQAVHIVAPAKLHDSQIFMLGTGSLKGLKSSDWTRLGGYVRAGVAGKHVPALSVVFDFDKAAASADEIADFALGAFLRHYRFDKYRKSKNNNENGNGNNNNNNNAGKPTLTRLTIHCADPRAAARAFRARKALGEGVFIARDLVNEPANILSPLEFAKRVKALKSTGLSVQVLDEPALRKLKMFSLLSVAQGSKQPARLAVMKWMGAKSKKAQPVCFVGKGVTFDTGGISIKPSAGMGDMKGDMGGAACVTGLMAALAKRKAKVNAIGIVGLVENMPGADAQRPGDVVTSMSGQTIEVLNTDAEGRLVLADAIWYAQQKFKPKFVIDLATLTGAIIVALGKEYAGLFSNNDRLAGQLDKAGLATNEKVWRMPLAPAFDKMINSKTADMKNIGGREAGSSTAAQFIKRFVKDVPWAHLDIAGTAMASPKSDINESWGSGYGVRLLDRLIADHYED